MKTWLTVAAIWLWCSAILAPTILVAPEEPYGEKIIRLIKQVREHIMNVSNDMRYGIPVLPDPSTITDEQKYFVLQIPSKSEAIFIVIGIDITSLCMMGYQSTNKSYFFNDTAVSAYNYLFNGTQKNWLPFNGCSYSVPNISLGISELNDAVTDLRSGLILVEDQVRSLSVVRQVILEAVKFRYVEHLVHKNIVDGQSFLPDPAMISLEETWEQLSDAIQESNQGIFSTPVELMRSNGNTFQVDTVSGVIVSNLAFMLFVCNEYQAATSFSRSLLIRPVVGARTCEVPEPTVHIVGENNLCVTVDKVNNGATAVLKNCTNAEDQYQFWTFKNDTRITYKTTDLCLTGFGNEVNTLTLLNCKDIEIVTWHLTGDGSIVAPLYQLAFTAKTLIQNPVPTLDNISYSVSQSWLATKFYGPFLTTIVLAETEFCLTTHQFTDLSVEYCASPTEQNWLLYADGSIRPQQKDSSCVTCLGDEVGSQVSVRPCAHNSTTQRWVFQNDGSIMNLKNGLVIQDEYTSLLVLSNHGELGNQLWLPLI